MAFSHTILRNSRSGNVKWTLRVALDRECYHPGDILQANVFLCVVEPVHCNGLVGYMRGEEKITWAEKTTRRAAGEEVYSRQNEFLNEKMIVARPKMYGPGEYIFPVVYQLHSTLPATFHLQRHPIGVMNAVHAQLEYVFYVCLTANQGVILEAQQAVVIQVAVLPNQPLMRLEMATPARRTDPVVASQQETNAFLSASLDKTAYRSGEVLRVRCRVNRQSGGRKSFTVFLRLYEDVDVTVAPSKHSEGSRLLCERSFQVAADATAFELALELVAVPGAPPIERMFCSSFVDRRHRLAVESFPPGSNSVAKCEIAVVIL